MANLTVVIDDDVLKRARMRALDQGTSVNALLRAYLDSYVAADRANRTVTRLLALSSAATSGSGGGHSWTREDLHER